MKAARRTEIQVTAIQALSPLVVGPYIDQVCADMGGLRSRTGWPIFRAEGGNWLR